MISRLHYISQSNSETSHLIAVDHALKAGCKWIQLRIKDQPFESILAVALEVRELCNYHHAKLIINDYPQIALLAKADGLHLGLSDLSIPEAQKIVGHQMIIGGTANTLADILQRVKEGADYIGLGPFKFTNTKKNLSPILGLDGYRKLLNDLKKMEIRVPIIAIGGIEIVDVASVMDTGVFGIAISNAITSANDRAKIVAGIYQKIENYRPIKTQLGC